MRLRILEYRGVQQPLLVGQSGEQIEAAARQAVIPERIRIGQRFQVKVPDPKPPVALGPVFVHGLHALGERGQPDAVDPDDRRVGGRSQRLRLARCRSDGPEPHAGHGEIERGPSQQLDFHIAERHPAREFDRRRRVHDGHHLVLQPSPAQPAGVRIERRVQLRRDLGERQPEAQRGIRIGAQPSYVEREIAGHMSSEIDDYFLTLLERVPVEGVHVARRNHPPPLKSPGIPNAFDQTDRSLYPFGQRGNVFRSLTQPSIPFGSEPCSLSAGRRRDQQRHRPKRLSYHVHNSELLWTAKACSRGTGLTKIAF